MIPGCLALKWMKSVLSAETGNCREAGLVQDDHEFPYNGTRRTVSGDEQG